MWMISALAFLALSPRLYMMIPQRTEQYVHVLRVSVVRNSLNSRTSARAAPGAKPNATRLDPAIPVAQTLKNWRRVSLTSIVTAPPSWAISGPVRSLGAGTCLSIGQLGERRVRKGWRIPHTMLVAPLLTHHSPNACQPTHRQVSSGYGVRPRARHAHPLPRSGEGRVRESVFFDGRVSFGRGG